MPGRPDLGGGGDPKLLPDSQGPVAVAEAATEHGEGPRRIQRFVSAPPATQARPRALDERTNREQDALLRLARGRSTTEIARELYLSEATVKTHVAHVVRKLGLRDRVQAVVYAYEAGLVSPGDT